MPNLSSDATLSALAVSNLPLFTFRSSATSYTESVTSDVTHVNVTPTCNDTNATVTVAVNRGPGGAVVSGVASGDLPLDVGTNTITIVVTAQDSSTKTYTIIINRPAAFVGQPVTVVTISTVTYGSSNNLINLGIQDSPTSVTITIPPLVGAVSVTGTSVYYTPATGYYGTDIFEYTANNVHGVSSPPQPAYIVVSDPILAPVPASLSATYNLADYSQPLSATGGQAPYTISLNSGSLPTGITLVDNVLSGTPTVLGTYTFTVLVTDSSTPVHTSTSVSYSLTVGLTPGAYAFNSTATVNYASINQPIILDTAGTVNSIRVVNTSTHGKLKITGSAINYTPTVNYYGTDSFTYFAIGPINTSSVATVNITITEPVILLSPASGALLNTYENYVYFEPLSVSGGASPYSFSVTSGALPVGMLINNGVLTGSPNTTGTYNFSITAKDSSIPAPVTSSQTYSLTALGTPPLRSTTGLLSHTLYDTLQTTATLVLSTYYGNTMSSSAVTAGTTAKTIDWINLYSDLDKSLKHQTGNNISFPCITTGTAINSAFVNSLTNVASTVYNNRSSISSSELISQLTTSSRTTTWGSDISHRVEYSWQNTDDVEHFFQSGGYIIPSLAIATNNLSNDLNVAWSTLISDTYNDYAFQHYIFNLSSYNTYPIASYTKTNINIGNISVSYYFTTPTTLVASLTLHPEGDYLYINTLPRAGFTVYRSSDAVYAPTTSIQSTETLDLGGALLYPSLYFYPVSQPNIHLSSTGTVYLTVANRGTGDCTVNSVLFTPDTSSGFETYSISIDKTTINPGNTATITLLVETNNSSQGTFYNNTVTIVSNNINGNVGTTFPVNITFPIFSVTINPESTSSILTVSDTVIQNFKFSTGASGSVEAITASLSTTGTNFGLYINQPNILSKPASVVTYNLGVLDPILSETTAYPGSVVTTFTPPIPQINYSNTASSIPPPTLITGTYTTTLSLSFIPSDNRQTAVGFTIPLSYTLDIRNEHLGSWLSPRDFTNNIAGFSYDYIEGNKYLTIGFGIGGDGSPELYNTGSAYVSATTLGIGADVKPGEGIVLYPATTGTNYGSFLKTYGSWITPNGGNGYDTNLEISYTFVVPTAGTYNYEFSVDASGELSINNVTVASWFDPSSSVTGRFNLVEGINTVRINCNAYANSANSSLYSVSGTLSGNSVSYIGPVYETKNNQQSISTSTVTTGLASFGVKITDQGGKVWWSTLNPQRPTLQPAYEFWGEVYRIPITGLAKTYNSGDYPIKLSDFAGGNTYGSYCGTGTNAGSAFTVIDDGNGNLNITFNAWPAITTTGVPNVDITLSLFEYLPYYYINIIPRILNLEAPFDNAEYTHYFTGFNNDGSVKNSTLAFPSPVIINGNIIVGGAGGKHLNFLQKAFQEVEHLGQSLINVLENLGSTIIKDVGNILGGIGNVVGGVLSGVGKVIQDIFHF